MSARYSRDELLDEWVLLHSEGVTVDLAAERLGMTVHALVKALQRARADGDPRARFDFHGYRRAYPRATA